MLAPAISPAPPRTLPRMAARILAAAQVVTKLHIILKPFLLRRIKSDVEGSLPAKKEMVLYAHMTQQQQEFNAQLRDKTLNVLPASQCCRLSPEWGERTRG